MSSTVSCIAAIALIFGQFYLISAQFGGGISSSGFSSQSSSGFNRGFGGGGFGGGIGQFGNRGFGGGSSSFQSTSVSGGGVNFNSGGFRNAENENMVEMARYASPYDSPAYAAPAPGPAPCPKNILISCSPIAQTIPCVQPAPNKY